MSEPQNINIGFRSAKLISFNFSPHYDKLEQPLEIDAYEFTITFSTQSPNSQTKLITSEIEAQVTEKATNNLLALIKSQFIFHIGNIEDFIKEEENKIVVSSGLLKLICGTSISTTRGLFAAEVKGSKIESAIIPIIDVSKVRPDQSKDLG